MRFFIDTYALIEIVKGNKNYERFLKEDLFTSLFNLYELCFYLVKTFNKSTANYFFDLFKENLVNVKKEQVIEASQFKLDNKKKRLSYADCLGHVIAKDYDMKFLTGDKEFEKFENVEFVK